MPDKPKKKGNILNIILAVTLAAIAALIALALLMFHHKVTEMDLSMPYEAYHPDDSAYLRLPLFGENLARSGGTVTIKGLTLGATSEKGILVDLDAKEVLFAQGIYDKAYPASITKLMTALLCVENGNMDEVVTMQESDFSLEAGSQVSGLAPGDHVSLGSLFQTLVVYSANDASMAIARTIDGSVDRFVRHMNTRAEELGLLQTHFTNPSGLHESELYTSAYDLYLLMNEIIQYSEFRDCCALSVYELQYTGNDGTPHSIYLDSTNQFATGVESLPQRISLLGAKTGTTDEAGACLAAAFQNEQGVSFIAVILNADNRTVLYNDMRQLMTCAAERSPDSTSPDSTSPGSTSPGSTSPGSTSPGSTSPGSTSPGSTSPDSTSPDSTSPGSTESGSLP